MGDSILHSILDRSGFSPTTRTSYVSIIDRWIAFAGADPKGWTRIKAQEFYDGLLASGITVKTANNYISSLRYVSRWYSTRVADPNADFAIVQVRNDDWVEKKRFALSEEEATKLLQACAPAIVTPLDLRDFAMVVVGLETGMRRKSLAGMNLSAMASHPKHGYPFVTVPVKGKGGTATYPVPLSDLCVEVLAQWRAWLVAHKYKTGAVFARLNKRIGKRGAIEWSPQGGLSLQMINKIIDQRAEAAGTVHLHPHLLRHTFITWRETAGLSFVQIASITGHRPGSADDDGIDTAKWKNMVGYIDFTEAANEARNSTPAWLAKLARGLLPRFKGLP